MIYCFLLLWFIQICASTVRRLEQGPILSKSSPIQLSSFDTIYSSDSDNVIIVPPLPHTHTPWAVNDIVLEFCERDLRVMLLSHFDY
jgi:hypothetical protein